MPRGIRAKITAGVAGVIALALSNVLIVANLAIFVLGFFIDFFDFLNVVLININSVEAGHLGNVLDCFCLSDLTHPGMGGGRGHTADLR